MGERIRVTVWNEARHERRVIANAVRWAAPGDGPVMKLGGSEPPLERL